MKVFINTFLLLLFFFFNFKGISQDIHLKSKFERIEIKKDSSFVNQTSILFKKSDVIRFYPIFYDTELEKVLNIQLYERKGKRFKKLSQKYISNEEVKFDYVTSTEMKSVMIPANKDIQLTYSLYCKELMYFSSLNFFSYNKIDTLKYQIKVPENFKLSHNTVYKDSLSFYKIDSTKVNTDFVLNIKVSPKKVVPDPMQIFGIYKNMKVPLMRTLILPSTYKNQPKKYMNEWYYKNTIPKKGLYPTVKQKIDELTTGINDPKEIVTIIYNYVQENFKYVAIEIGMGAFIPSHANEVFFNKQGDCKDLSNFLSEALRYKGIKSDIALAATFDHINDCNFPSLSSANHVICVAYINDEIILLDPTDPIHVANTPVESLQNRTILIINSTEGLFYKVKPFSPQKNEIYYKINLALNTNEMLINGAFNVSYKGISSNYLKRIFKDKSEKEVEVLGKEFYEEVFGNQSVSNLKLINQSVKMDLKGELSVTGKTFNDASNKYLFLDFLPRLFETENRESLINGTYLGNPFYKKIRLRIKIDEPIETFEPITHVYKGKGIALNVAIKSISNLEIECDYDFIFDHIFIEKENSKETNEVLKSFKKIINEPIVLKKKKS